MDPSQMIEVGYNERIDVNFKKTNMKKINTENSKCIVDEDYYGSENCFFKQVSFKILHKFT